MNDQSREIERRLGEAYAEMLRQNPHADNPYRDCKEVIQSSLGVLDHYNRIALAMKGAFSPKRRAFATANVPTQ
ncbi:hypothetical protein EMOOHJMP_00141 [Microcystis phage MaAM05]|jgi:hypothetical protein|nr:hypothetical protein EMOOHJMP_00141 [Microcystis phage MaAM05]